MLGTGTSMPDSTRVQSGMLVQSKDTTVLADVGSGVLHRLVQYGFDFRTLDAVFLSHFHVDHCSDFMTLCQTLWLENYSKQLDVFGPPPILEWMKTQFEEAFAYLAEKMDLQVGVLSEGTDTPIDDLIVSNVATCHGTVDARALRFVEDERVVVFSSDTAPCENVKALATGADLLIHECNWLDGEYPKEVHTSPSELAEVVEAARPREVVLTHISPEVVAKEKEVVDIVKGSTDSSVSLGNDLMVVDV
jgi:ribonuclease BN (tRNA processing enzyme)